MLKHVVVNTENELSAPSGKPEKKKKGFFSFLWRFIFILLFTAIISFSAQITYDFTRYESFFVSGMSMYPTLNRDVSFTDSNKTTYKGNDSELGPAYYWGDFDGNFSYATAGSAHLSGDYICDYGLMDTKDGFLDGIKRFDIVATYYPEDYDTSGNLNSEATYKIKRVIALPGESFYFDASGDLYVEEVGSTIFNLVEQPFLDYAMDVDGIASWKEDTLLGFSSYAAEDVIETGEGYFLCGDNRLKRLSEDSRSVGAIPSYMIGGKAVCLFGKCKYTYKTKKSQPIFTSFKMPWQLEPLNE